MRWWRSRCADDEPEIAELAEQVRRSDEQADQDLAAARTMAAHAYAVAGRLDELTVANGFGDWVVRQVAGPRKGER